MAEKSISKGVSLDPGTMNVVSARRTPKGVTFSRMRDAFLDLDISAKKMLKLGGVNFIERDDKIIIVGDAALETANIFGREPRRPLKAGLISPSEMDALEILGLIIKHVLGDPVEPGEICCLCVPASPVDAPDLDVVYHQGVLERIVSECGFTPLSSNEAMAIVFSETAKEGFSGLVFSFGSGMTNVALALNTIEGLSFSVQGGGDSIDLGAAKAVGSTSARMCAIKEAGFNLMAPVGREQEALSMYYKSLIDNCLKHVVLEFKKIEGKFALPKPIPIVVAGGTSLAGGFLEFFKECFEKRRKKFPIEISEIRQAADPLNAVAQGLLLQAIQEYEND